MGFDFFRNEGRVIRKLVGVKVVEVIGLCFKGRKRNGLEVVRKGDGMWGIWRDK